MKKYLIGALLIVMVSQNDTTAVFNPFKACIKKKVAPPAQAEPQTSPSPILQTNNTDSKFVFLKGHQINKNPTTNQEAQANILAALNIAREEDLIKVGIFDYYFGYLRLLHALHNAQEITPEDKILEQNLINDASIRLIRNIKGAILAIQKPAHSSYKELLDMPLYDSDTTQANTDDQDDHFKIAPITLENRTTPLTNQEAQENLLILLNIARAENLIESHLYDNHLNCLHHLHTYYSATHLSNEDKQIEQAIIHFASTQVIKDIETTTLAIDQLAQ